MNMGKNEWIYTKVEEMDVREVTIDSGKGGEAAVIVQITDLHYNKCLESDLKNPVLASTYQGRKWLADGKSVPRVRECLDYADSVSPDMIVITGDVLDYLSDGAIELLRTEIWDRYRDESGEVKGILIALGGHEVTRHMQASPDIKDPTSFESRMQILESVWEHDVYYTSRVIGEKAMVIVLDNGTKNGFWECQREPLLRDLALAREKGYAVLIFGHDPLCTYNPNETEVYASMVGDPKGARRNFSALGVGSSRADDITKEIYSIIVNNADVIKGIFVGHYHNDFYTEIVAKTHDGEDTVIPQYVLIGTPYGKGNALKITVK